MNEPILRDITPAGRLSSPGTMNQSLACAGFGDTLYLAQIVHDDSSAQDHCKIDAYAFKTGEWHTCLDARPAMRPAEINGQATRCRIGIFDDPDLNRQSVFVRFDSPRGRLLVRADEQESFTPVADLHQNIERQLCCEETLVLEGRAIGITTANSQLASILDLSLDAPRDWLASLRTHTQAPVSQAAICSGALYAATIEPERGFAIWKTAVERIPEWQCVLERGAYRFAHNQQVLSMAPHGGSLFLATGTPPDARHPDSKFFDYQGFEIIRLDPDEGWDLIAGIPRFSPAGLMLPLSALDPALEASRSREWRLLQAHAGQLILAATDEEGLRLWSSTTGEHWRKLENAGLQQIHRVDRCRLIGCGVHAGLILDGTDLDGLCDTRLWSLNLGTCGAEAGLSS